MSGAEAKERPVDSGEGKMSREPRGGGSEGGDMAREHDVGEKPGVGRYCCTNCGWSVYLDDPDDRLPPCGSCGKGQDTTYRHC